MSTRNFVFNLFCSSHCFFCHSIHAHILFGCVLLALASTMRRSRGPENWKHLAPPSPIATFLFPANSNTLLHFVRLFSTYSAGTDWNESKAFLICVLIRDYLPHSVPNWTRHVSLAWKSTSQRAVYLYCSNSSLFVLIHDVESPYFVFLSTESPSLRRVRFCPNDALYPTLPSTSCCRLVLLPPHAALPKASIQI